MKHCFHILSIAILALITACSAQPDVLQDITDAEHLADAGNYADALAICDRLVTTSDSSLLTATQLCRVAVIYAVAADNDIDNDANIARAIHSFGSAYALNPDSVSAYVDGLTLDRLSAVRTVLQLLRFQNDDSNGYQDIEDIAASQLDEDAALDSICIYNHEQ